MKFRLSGRAEREFENEIASLEERSLSAARRFSSSVKRAIQQLLRYPASGTATSDGNARKFPVRGFSFLIYYELDGDELLILSIFHTSRDPEERPY